MEIGIKNVIEIEVNDDNTAAAMGSGTLAVGQCTVGTKLDVSHLSPTPVGMAVKCETELVGVDGRCLKFKAEVFDETGLIGTGTHERFIVYSEKFQTKADGKKG